MCVFEYGLSGPDRCGCAAIELACDDSSGATGLDVLSLAFEAVVVLLTVELVSKGRDETGGSFEDSNIGFWLLLVGTGFVATVGALSDSALSDFDFESCQVDDSSSLLSCFLLYHMKKKIEKISSEHLIIEIGKKKPDTLTYPFLVALRRFTSGILHSTPNAAQFYIYEQDELVIDSWYYNQDNLYLLCKACEP